MRIASAASLLFFLLLPPSARAAETVITFSFDDTFDDQLQAAPMFAAAGVHGTFYLNSARLGQSGFMTIDQARMLQTMGNEIGGHTVDHLTLESIPPDEQQRQMCNDRSALLGLGLNVTSLAYPHGSAPVGTEALASACGYGSARDSSGLHATAVMGCSGCPYAEQMPPGNAFAIRTERSVMSTDTLAGLEQAVLDAETHGGGWVTFVFHHVCDGCADNAIAPATLQGLVSWIAMRKANGTTVETIQEVIGGPVAPAVLGPASSPFYAADGNILRNADLETDSDGDGVPDCFEILTGGAVETAVTTSNAPLPHSGTVATQIELPAGMMGTPRVASLQDLGYCAPPAKPNDVFAFSFYYQSTEAVAPVAYYRIDSGWWKTLAIGPSLPASAAWTQSQWTLPPMPADATAISVGVEISGSGTLAVDDFFLTNTTSPPPPDGATSMDAGSGDAEDLGVPADHSDASWTETDPPPPKDSGCALVAPRTGSIATLMAVIGLLVTLMVRGPGRRR
jgi:peptidoglycan/xylan/chitin deacetylase (PgdA/CDA1 family)